MNFTYDTAFAHAVRRSVHSIKLSISKAEEQGKRLAEILRDETSDLDEHGWKLFRQAVKGERLVKKIDNESEFAQAIRQAFKDARGYDRNKRPTNWNRAIEGADLAGILGNQLGMGERELLAQMATRTGQTFWFDGTEYDGVDLDGAPEKGAGHPDVIYVVRLLRHVRKNQLKAKPISPEKAAQLKEIKEDMRNLREWIKLDEEDKAHAQRQGKPTDKIERGMKQRKDELQELENSIPKKRSAEAIVKEHLQEIEKREKPKAIKRDKIKTIKNYEEITIEYERKISALKAEMKNSA